MSNAGEILLKIFDEYADDPNCPKSIDDLPELEAKFRQKKTLEANKTADVIRSWRMSMLAHIEAEWDD